MTKAPETGRADDVIFVQITTGVFKAVDFGQISTFPDRIIDNVAEPERPRIRVEWVIVNHGNGQQKTGALTNGEFDATWRLQRKLQIKEATYTSKFLSHFLIKTISPASKADQIRMQAGQVGRSVSVYVVVDGRQRHCITCVVHQPRHFAGIERRGADQSRRTAAVVAQRVRIAAV